MPPRIRIGLFSDIHFQDLNLKAIRKCAGWIREEFKRQRVTDVVCLGDLLNTREMVSVQALSSAAEELDQMQRLLNCRIHLICGNHDLNLRHSTQISSLDIFDLNREKFVVYKEMQKIYIGNQPVHMLPFQEDSLNIRNYLVEHGNPEDVAFCHMSIPGAIMRMTKDQRGSVYHTNYEESERKSVPKYLTDLKRVISGHFHHHHYLSDNVLYCGAPMQHHFGDAGDSSRGICIYEPENDTVEFIQNPEWDRYRLLHLSKGDRIEDFNEFKGKYVSLASRSNSPNDIPMLEVIQHRLIDSGALQARIEPLRFSKQSTLPVSKREINISSKKSIHTVIKEYSDIHQLDKNHYQLGLELVDESLKENRHLNSKLEGESFIANLQSITIENFLSVQGPITISIQDLRKGVYYIRGKNGSGKSAILEAISWCLFDRFLRSDMKADFAVNDVKKKDCRVVLSFSNGYTIQRYRKYQAKSAEKQSEYQGDIPPPRKGTGVLVYRDKKELLEVVRGTSRDTQKALEDLIGIDHSMFLKSVILSENAMLGLGDASQRREFIEDILELNMFDSFLETVREKKRAIERDIIGITSKIEFIQDQERARLEEDLKKQENQEEKSLLCRRIEELKQKMEDISVRKNHEEKEGVETEEKIFMLKKDWELRKAFEIYEKYLKVCEQLEKQVPLVNDGELKSIQDNIEELKQQKSERMAEYANFKNLLGKSKCITCQQPISESFQKEISIKIHKKLGPEIQKLTKLLQENLRTSQTLSASKEKQQRTLHELHAKKNVMFSQIAKDIEELEMFEKPDWNYDSDYITVVQQLRHKHNENKIKLLTEEHEAKQALSKCYSELKLLNQPLRQDDQSDMLEKLEQQLKETGKNLPMLTFWEQAFSAKPKKNFQSIRNFVIHQSIQDLNKIMDYYNRFLSHQQLAKHTEISFDDNLKLSEEFGKRSAGQRKRNQLVMFFALFELVRQRCRFRANFLMLDEIFDALDEAGQRDVQQCIDMLSRRIDYVFVITHSQIAVEGIKDEYTLNVQYESNKLGTQYPDWPLH